MKGFRFILIAVIALGLAGSAGAAGPMALTRDGDLYSVTAHETRLVVTARLADGPVIDFVVPQSAAAIADSLQVGVDEASGSLYVVWQTRTGIHANVKLAAYVDGTWIGPVTIGGFDGYAASNPQLLVHRATSVVTEEMLVGDQPSYTEVATTFLHLGWWSQAGDQDKGKARYLAIPLEADGSFYTGDLQAVDLAELLPYGVACFDIDASDNLNHPKLFIDPQSRKPHIFVTDYAECAFQIMELRPVVIEEIDDAGEKRRRQIIILRHGSTIAMRRNLPLATAKLEIGTDLSIVMHWDEGVDQLKYILLDKDGTSETKSLMIDQLLTHENAVELIRGLTN